ncbi:hypothetical protein V6N13_047904 [Hibiscus sabdariffa]
MKDRENLEENRAVPTTTVPIVEEDGSLSEPYGPWIVAVDRRRRSRHSGWVGTGQELSNEARGTVQAHGSKFNVAYLESNPSWRTKAGNMLQQFLKG